MCAYRNIEKDFMVLRQLILNQVPHTLINDNFRIRYLIQKLQKRKHTQKNKRYVHIKYIAGKTIMDFIELA